jgi:multidrug efflux pump subunit AcrA (membrane-fusion protein)
MTWRKRIGLALGLLSVVVLAAGLTMIVNTNNGKVDGKSASLVAEDYPVGTDYSGTVTEQYVKVGDQVAAGQPIFEIQSAALERDLAQGLVNKDNLTHEVKNDNTLVITATVGQIQVRTENGEARTMVKAYSDELANGTGLFAVGTPVQATLHLNNDGPVTDVTKTVTGWFGIAA